MVNTAWNIPLLNGLLQDYHDKKITDFLQYSFPVEREEVPLELGDRNHKGVTMHPEQVTKYISKEISLGATIGPFDSIPFKAPVAISPISTRPKKDSADRRIILDCSWPIRTSLNDGIDKNMYLGDKVELSYPNVDTLARRVHFLASRKDAEPVMFFKEDLDRAFRQLAADLFSVLLLGFKWQEKIYFDLVMVMGCRIAPFICQRTTNMITYIFERMSYFALNYVDDFLGVDYQSRIKEAHCAFIRLLRDIRVQRSLKKSVSLTPVIEFIGTLFNVIDMTIGITSHRKVELLHELNKWRFKDTTETRAFIRFSPVDGNEMDEKRGGVPYATRSKERHLVVVRVHSRLPRFKRTLVARL